MRLGIIGFGNFGRFMAEHLRPHFDLCVSDARDIAAEARRRGVKAVSLVKAVSQDIVVFAVPVQFLEALLAEVGASVNPSALVLDVSSVKIKPLDLLLRYLPPTVEILGTHPLFGPNSGRNGIAGLKIALCPVRTTKADEVRRFLENTLNLLVFERTPEAHDREMAYVQGLTHFVGRALAATDLPASELSTLPYDALKTIFDILKDDTFDLFQTIQRENPFAEDVRKRLMHELIDLDRRLDQSSERCSDAGITSQYP